MVPQHPPTMLSPNSSTKRVVRVGQRLGREVVVRVAVDDRRQARVGEARQVRAGVLREVAQVLGHLRGTGRAVEPDDVGPHRLERGERGADLRADEQAAGGLDRHLHHDRARSTPAVAIARRAPMIAALHWSRSCTVSIEQDVDAAGEEAGDHGLVVVAQRRRRRSGPSEGRRVPGPIEPITKRGRSGVEKSAADLLGQARRLLVDGEGLLGDAVLVEHEAEGAEGGGLHRVDAGLEVLGVHAADELGARASTRRSLQPSSAGPPKSSGPRSWSWTHVPNAPSNTSTRSASVARNSDIRVRVPEGFREPCL